MKEDDVKGGMDAKRARMEKGLGWKRNKMKRAGMETRRGERGR